MLYAERGARAAISALLVLRKSKLTGICLRWHQVLHDKQSLQLYPALVDCSHAYLAVLQLVMGR